MKINPSINDNLSLEIADIIAGEPCSYDCTKLNVWPFKKAEDIVEGVELRFTNLAGGFPFDAAGYRWNTSEALYIAGQFSKEGKEYESIQQVLLKEPNGFKAKKMLKARHKDLIRPDFEEFRVDWMLWVLWQKIQTNGAFRRRLMRVPVDAVIIEDSTSQKSSTSAYWGSKNPILWEVRNTVKCDLEKTARYSTQKELAQIVNLKINAIRNIGAFVGVNALGRLLMICRRCLEEGTVPPINMELLTSKGIYIMGKRIAA